MTEKQRWLLGDLDRWERDQLDKIGRYGPRKITKPASLRRAQQQVRRLTAQIDRQEKRARQPYERAKAKISATHQAVRRIILFEKTERALAAIRALKET